MCVDVKIGDRGMLEGPEAKGSELWKVLDFLCLKISPYFFMDTAGRW